MKHLTLLTVSSVLLFCILLATSALAMDGIGQVVVVRGKVYIQRDNRRIEAKVKSLLQLKDTVITTAGAKVKILFDDNGVVTLAEKTQLVLREYIKSKGTTRGQSVLNVVDGKMRAVVGKNRFEVHTPTAVAAARGTILYAGTDFIYVSEGAVTVTRQQIENMTSVGAAGKANVDLSKARAVTGESVTLRAGEVIVNDGGTLRVLPAPPDFKKGIQNATSVDKNSVDERREQEAKAKQEASAAEADAKLKAKAVAEAEIKAKAAAEAAARADADDKTKADAAKAAAELSAKRAAQSAAEANVKAAAEGSARAEADTRAAQTSAALQTATDAVAAATDPVARAAAEVTARAAAEAAGSAAAEAATRAVQEAATRAAADVAVQAAAKAAAESSSAQSATTAASAQQRANATQQTQAVAAAANRSAQTAAIVALLDPATQRAADAASRAAVLVTASVDSSQGTQGTADPVVTQQQENIATARGVADNIAREAADAARDNIVAITTLTAQTPQGGTNPPVSTPVYTPGSNIPQTFIPPVTFQPPTHKIPIIINIRDSGSVSPPVTGVTGSTGSSGGTLKR